MASSQARIDANRRNALKSTGPKTAEGKAKSRANALKHGLAGEGVVLFPDDQAKVEELEAKLVADTPPGNEVVAALLHRFAILSIRLDRCAEHDAAMTAHRVRHAVADHDNQRHAEVAEQAGRLGADPFDAVRRLKQGPEGIDWLLRRWKALRDEVAAPTPGPADLIDRAGALLGMTAAESRVSEWGARCLALAGETGGADARAWVLAQIDAEVELLRWLRADVDEETEEADRAEAPKRALFDFGPHAERLRRYEAAAERHLYRTIKELRQEREIVVALENAPRPALVPAPVPSRFQNPVPAPMPATATAPAPKPAPIPPPPPRTPAQARLLTPVERSILDDLPGKARALALEYSDFIDITAIPAAVAEVRRHRKAHRPKLG